MSKAIQHRYFIPGFAEHSPKPGIKKYSPLKGWALRLLGYALKYNGSYLNKKSAVKLINSHPRSFLLTNHLKKKQLNSHNQSRIKTISAASSESKSTQTKKSLTSTTSIKKNFRKSVKTPSISFIKPKNETSFRLDRTAAN